MLFLPSGDAGFLNFQLDTHMLLFTAAVTVITALLFGFLPAMQASRFSPAARTAGSGPRVVWTAAQSSPEALWSRKLRFVLF